MDRRKREKKTLLRFPEKKVGTGEKGRIWAWHRTVEEGVGRRNDAVQARVA